MDKQETKEESISFNEVIGLEENKKSTISYNDPKYKMQINCAFPTKSNNEEIDNKIIEILGKQFLKNTIFS